MGFREFFRKDFLAENWKNLELIFLRKNVQKIY